jgi:integrase
MTDKAISPLRRRLIEDMTIRRLSPKTQLHYIRHVKRFADFLGRSADKATTEDVHRYQLWLASIGTTVPTVNVSATALRFFFKVTLRRHDLAQEVVSTREPRRLPVVLSPEEVGRLLASARNIKHKAASTRGAHEREPGCMPRSRRRRLAGRPVFSGSAPPELEARRCGTQCCLSNPKTPVSMAVPGRYTGWLWACCPF